MHVVVLYDKENVVFFSTTGDEPVTQLISSLVKKNASTLFGSGFAENQFYILTQGELDMSDDVSASQSILSDLDIDSHIIEI